MNKGKTLKMLICKLIHFWNEQVALQLLLF